MSGGLLGFGTRIVTKNEYDFNNLLKNLSEILEQCTISM